MGDFIVYGLAVWRLTDMLVGEAGPGGVFEKLRAWSGVVEGPVVTTKNDWTPLACTLCTSIWVAVALWRAPKVVRGALAASGMSVLLGKMLETAL